MSTELPGEGEKDILETAEENPDEIDVAGVVALLDHKQSQTRNVALMTLRRLADDDPARVADHTDMVIDRLHDDFPVAQSTAASVLSRISPEHPDEVRPAIPRLVEMLGQDPPLTGFRAGRAIAPLIEHAPEDFVEVTDKLLALFEDLPDAGIPSEEELEQMDPEVRERTLSMLDERGREAQLDIRRSYGAREMAVHTLVEVTDVEPEAVGGRVVELRPIFDAEPPIARAAAMDVVANVARHDPAAVEPIVEDVIEIAETDTKQIRAHAIQALGHAGATEAIEPLREIAESDDTTVTPHLSELATETADFLESKV